MKKWIDILVRRILTVSGFTTSAAILLIIGFLFKEAVGLFGNPIVDKGYVLALNPQNPVSSLSAQEIKNLFDEEITNWKEVGARIFRSRCSVWKIWTSYIPKQNWARNTNVPEKRSRNR